MRILAADDDSISLRLLVHALETLGHDVTPATSGEEAWATYRTAPFPVVVSDWMMPDMDGLQFCRNIRSTTGTGYAYVILLSAQNERADRLHALEAGVDDFLSKPLDRAELAARLVIARRINYWESSLRAANNELLLTSQLLAAQAEELERMRLEAERLATYDSMTNVFSRRAWFEQPPGTVRSIAIVDVDHFKAINDRFGHPVGDVVLATVAERLTECLGEYATLGRVGGEEFGIAFHCEIEKAVELCRACVATFEAPIACPDEPPIAVTISIGLAPRSGVSSVNEIMPELYRAADRALYKAKEGGRNRLSIARSAAA
jgi:diguanylate cyclase (GGDEF)-like protein